MIELHLPPKPAIIRAAEADLRKDWRQMRREVAQEIREARKANFLPGMGHGFIAGAAALPAVTVSLLSSGNGSTSNLTTYSIGSVNFGAEEATRCIIIVSHTFAASNNTTLSSATIGGVAAIVAVSNGASGGNYGTAISIARVPTGTSGTVALTFAAGMSGVQFAVYRALNIISTTAIDTDNGGTGNGLDNMAVDVQVGGLVIAGSTRNTGGNTWTGVTEDYDAADTHLDSAAGQVSGASLVPVATETARAITNNGGDFYRNCVASWR